MLRQSLNPRMPQFGKAMKNNSEVTEKELVFQLESRTKTAVMLSDSKKTFLKDVLENTQKIISHSEAFDGLMSSSLAPSFRKLIPSNIRMIDKTSNSDLSLIVAKILPPVRVLRSCILSQYEAENKRKGNLRTSTKSKQPRTVVMKILDRGYEVLEALESRVYANRSSLGVNTLCKPVKLTDIQRERKWTKELVPKQKHLQRCPLCDHESTNYPPENAAIAEYNRKKENEFHTKTKKWDQYMKDKNNGKSLSPPEGMTRRPYRRDFKEPIIMCMCATSYCLGEFDTAAESCPIKCLKPVATKEQKVDLVKLEPGTCTVQSSSYAKIKTEPNVSSASEKSNVDGATSNNSCTGEVSDPIRQVRYKFSGIPKACDCPICRCRCNFACVISDVPKIMESRRLDERIQMSPKKQVVDASEYASSSPGFLGNIMSDAMKIGWKAMKNEGQNMSFTRDKRVLDEKTEMYIENRGVTAACEEAAATIVCKATSLPMEEKIKYRNLIGGKPTTDVLLPSGDKFSTKSLIGNDKHSKNNRLGVTETLDAGRSPGHNYDNNDCDIEVLEVYKPKPGMRTNLQIDWNNQSKQFQEFLQMKSTQNDINYEKHERKKHNSSKKPSVQPMKLKGTYLSSDDSSCMILDQEDKVKVIKNPQEKTKHVKISNMHDRIMIKSKAQLTTAINERIKDKSNERVKDKVKDLKNVIVTLQQSERDGTHISTIENVTNDGEDINETSSLNSEDVLERVKVYHDIL